MNVDTRSSAPRWNNELTGDTRSTRDLLVVEIAGSTAGAYAAKLLGDVGATVVCLEPPHGASLRSDPAKWTAWSAQKRTAIEGSADAQTWLRRADVIIESSNAGAIASSELTIPESAVHVRISPFGDSGPYSGWTSTDIVDQAIGGHLYLSGSPQREPICGPTGQAALAAGVYGAIGAMAALHARSRNGGYGQRVEVTHQEALTALHQFTDVRYTHTGDILRRMGNRYAGPGSPIGMYRAGDGSIALTVATAAHGEILLALTGLDHLLELPEIETITDLMVNNAIFEPALEGWLATQTVADTVELFQSARIAAGPVSSMHQVLADPHLEQRDWWGSTDVDGKTVRLPGPPFRIDGIPRSSDSTAPNSAGDSASDPASDSASDPARAADTSPRPSHNAENRSDAPVRPLAGLRVLDLTRVWAGPLAARILSELGADVVMVEAPWARTTRTMPMSYVHASHFFPNDDPLPHPWNRHGFVNKFALTKRSLGLDINTPEGRAVLERLLPNVDVLIENYSPRVMPNLGFSEARMRELNPELLYVTMPGYGRSGPATDYSAYGPVLDSHAGLTSLMGYPDVGPWKCGIAWPDPVAGIHTAFAVLATLWERDALAPGRTIEVPQFETAISMIADRLVRAQLDGSEPVVMGNRHEEFAPQGVYRALGDDAWLALSVTTDANWTSLCSLISSPTGWSEWSVAERFAHHDDIDTHLTSWSASRLATQSATELQSHGIAAAPVADAALLDADPHLRARSFYTRVEHPEAGLHDWGPTCAARLSTTPAIVGGPAPCLGQHNRDVLTAWAGLSGSEIDALIAAGIVADQPPA